MDGTSSRRQIGGFAPRNPTLIRCTVGARRPAPRPDLRATPDSGSSATLLRTIPRKVPTSST